jgi:monoamine oxidase
MPQLPDWPRPSRRQVITTAAAATAAAALGTVAAASRPQRDANTITTTPGAQAAARDILRHDDQGTDLTGTWHNMLTGTVTITPRPKRIVVIGAGITGMTCAYMLARAGHQVRIMEANPTHTGGRILTLRDGWSHPAAYAEAGAMRIPDQHTLVTGLCRHLGVGLRPFTAYNPDRTISVNGMYSSVDGYNTKPAIVNKTFGSTSGKTARAMLDDAFKEARNTCTDADGWAQWLTQYDNHSLERYLQDKQYTAGDIDLIGTLENLTARMYLAVVHSFLMTRHLPATGARQWEIPGGMDTLPTMLSAKLATLDDRMINTGWRLTQVDSRATKIQLTVTKHDDPANEQIIEADHAILTVPYPALRYIRFTPGLSYDKTRAIQELHYDEATKVLLEFNQKWWTTDGATDRSDSALRYTVYPSHPSGDGGIITASYTWSDDAAGWDSLPPEQMAKRALILLGEQHGLEVAKRYTGRWHAKSWANDAYAHGEAAIYTPGQATTIGPATRTPEADGRLHFAGDGTSTAHRAWIEGAIESACRVAYQLGIRPDNTDNRRSALTTPGK